MRRVNSRGCEPRNQHSLPQPVSEQRIRPTPCRPAIRFVNGIPICSSNSADRNSLGRLEKRTFQCSSVGSRGELGGTTSHPTSWPAREGRCGQSTGPGNSSKERAPILQFLPEAESPRDVAVQPGALTSGKSTPESNALVKQGPSIAAKPPTRRSARRS
jgi:hypothetical protein